MGIASHRPALSLLLSASLDAQYLPNLTPRPKALLLVHIQHSASINICEKVPTAVFKEWISPKTRKENQLRHKTSCLEMKIFLFLAYPPNSEQ